MDCGFDPYHRWLGIPPAEQPANHYRLLGLAPFESDPEVIRDAAERQMAHVRTYQLGQCAELSQKILNELARAKACLLDREQKRQYDLRLRSVSQGTTSRSPSVPHRPAASSPTPVAASPERSADDLSTAFPHRHLWQPRPKPVVWAAAGLGAVFLLASAWLWMRPAGGPAVPVASTLAVPSDKDATSETTSASHAATSETAESATSVAATSGVERAATAASGDSAPPQSDEDEASSQGPSEPASLGVPIAPLTGESPSPAPETDGPGRAGTADGPPAEPIQPVFRDHPASHSGRPDSTTETAGDRRIQQEPTAEADEPQFGPRSPDQVRWTPTSPEKPPQPDERAERRAVRPVQPPVANPFGSGFGGNSVPAPQWPTRRQGPVFGVQKQIELKLPSGETFSSDIFDVPDNKMSDMVEAWAQGKPGLIGLTDSGDRLLAIASHQGGWVADGPIFALNRNEEPEVYAEYDEKRNLKGLLKTWDDRGGREYWCQYIRDRLHGFCCLFDNDQLKAVARYENGRLNSITLVSNNTAQEHFATETEAHADPAATAVLQELERKQTHVKKRLAELREQVRRQEEEERKARVSRLNPGKRSAISARMNQRRAETGEFISGQMRRNTP